jgi:DNA-binding response OmpR family regulator
MMNERILVVDDDPLVRKSMKFQLEQAGYRVTASADGRSARQQAGLHHFDLAILDIGLPEEDGMALCRAIKAEQAIPVVFLTARRLEIDEIVGLEAGADDYITKPCGADLVLAHVRALLRRTPASQPTEPADGVVCGGFSLEPESHRASFRGSPLDLSPREFDLLRLFMTHPDRVFSAEELLDAIWGAEFTGEPQVLYVQIRGLRVKIEPNPSSPCHLLTLRGVGYKFVP